MAHDSAPASVKIAPPPRNWSVRHWWRTTAVWPDLDTVAGVIENKTPGWWKVIFGISLIVFLAYLLAWFTLSQPVSVSGGLNHPWPGLGHRKLCLVDRYRSRGHADLGYPVFVAPKMAYLDQPCLGGDDDF